MTALPYQDKPFIVFSDFDGTITTEDSNDAATDNLGFGLEKRRALNLEILNGTQCFRDGFKLMIDSIAAKHTFDEMREYLKNKIKLDAGFKDFFLWCKEHDVPVVIVSSGMVPIIRAIMENLVGVEDAAKIDIIANDVEHKPDGTWTIKFRHPESGFGHDKSRTTAPYRDLPGGGPTLFFCGDGVSDLSAARAADLLFVKVIPGHTNDLQVHCYREKIPYLPFASFEHVVEEEKSESGSEGDSSDEVAANLTSPAKGTATRRGRAPAAALSESDDAGGDEPDAPQEEEPAEEESGEEALSEAVVSQKDLLAGDASHAQSSGEGNAVVVVAQTRKRAKNVYSSAAKKKSDAAGRVAREDEPRSPAAPAARSVVARSPTKRRKAPSDDEYDELESSDADDSEEIPPERDPWNGDEDLADVLANAPDGVLFLRWNSSKSRPARFWLPPKELWPLKEDMEQSWVDSPHYEYRDSETGVRNVIEEYKSTVVAHEDMTKADFVVVPPGLASRHPKKYLDYTNLAKDYRIPVLSSLFIAESVRDADQAVEDNTKVRLRDYQKYILQPPNPNTGPRERFTSDDANKLAKAIHKRNGNRPRAFEHLAKKTHSSKSWKNFYTTRKRDIDRMVDDFARERWEDAKIDPEPQLFALAADLKRVVNRLAAVEGFLQTLPAELRVGAPRPQRISPMFGGGDAPDAYSPDNLPLSTPQGREDPEMHNNSDTEEAAVNLEAAAFAINLEAGWSCSVQLGLDFGIAPEDVEAARKEAVAKVLLCFPDKTTSYFLVAQYFEDFDWIHHTVHQPSFQAELDRFWEMHAQGRESDVDPLWLSLYAMVSDADFGSNLNDSDLSTTEWRTNPLPRNIVTDASFEYAKFVMALQSRKVFDKLVSESETFSYHTVMELDREYRQVLDRLPDEWKTEHAQKEKKHPQLRHVCQEGIHSRIVRLHRPFLTRGYTAGSRFRYSTEQCVASARIVISTHHNILDVTNNVWFLYSHALGAAIVLFCDLFHAIDSPSNSGLFMAEEKRRVTRLINDGKPHTVESFAQVLQRISSSLDFKVPEDIEQSAAEVLATLPAFAGTPSNGMGSATPFPSVHPGDDPNIDHLSSMFYQDLGMPQGGGSGASFWQTSNVEDVNGPTPPDTYSFLGTQIDWANIGMNQQPSGAPLDANALAATALLDQMSLPW
ncbi:hypothetical protein RQP46_001168 [Phenoliferia psychrophenolica]